MQFIDASLTNFIVMLILTLLMGFVYFKARIPFLYITLYLIFLIVAYNAFLDINIPLYPWSPLFLLVLVTFLLIDIAYGLKDEGGD